MEAKNAEKSTATDLLGVKMFEPAGQPGGRTRGKIE
jgi:hypothetical protein